MDNNGFEEVDNSKYKQLDYNGLCSMCQERYGPLSYHCEDYTNLENSGLYDQYGTVVKPNYMMVNNATINTLNARENREYINSKIAENIIYLKKITIKNSLDYYWSPGNIPAECLVVHYEFNKDENNQDIDSFTAVIGDNSKISSMSDHKHTLVDKFGSRVTPIEYGYELVVSDNEPPMYSPEVVSKLQETYKSETKDQFARNNRLL